MGFRASRVRIWEAGLSALSWVSWSSTGGSYVWLQAKLKSCGPSSNMEEYERARITVCPQHDLILLLDLIQISHCEVFWWDVLSMIWSSRLILYKYITVRSSDGMSNAMRRLGWNSPSSTVSLLKLWFSETGYFPVVFFFLVYGKL